MSFSYEHKSTFASLPRTERGHGFILGGDPKGKTFLYTHDTNVYIRDIENPKICDVYSYHSYQTSVAKYAPSGFYIASGDAAGKIRIWDTTQKEHILKYEYQPISGKIADIAWSSDSKRIAVCGEGKDKFAAVFLWDSGSTVGELKTNSRPCNAIDYRPTRPFRLVVASEDMTTAIYEGPPFKGNRQLKDHTKFVQIVRYSPDGSLFATGSSDCKVFLYDGKTGELVGELKDNDSAHSLGVNSLCFSPDGTQLLTASGDQSAKLWDVSTKQLITKFVLGNTIEDQQLTCLWQGDYMLSGSLSGYINYLDKNNPAQPLRIIKGHNKNISTLSLSSDKKTIFTSGLENKVMCWNAETGDCEIATGSAHRSMVNSMSTTGNTVVSVGVDDKIRFMDINKQEFTDTVIGLDSQPHSVSASGDLMAVGTVSEIILFKDNSQIYNEKVNYEAKAVDLHPSGKQLAVGGSDNKVHIFNIEDNELKEVNQLTITGPINTLKFSPDGTHLAGNDNKAIVLWKVEGFEPLKTYWTAHCARVTVVNWSPDSKRFASGSLDGCIGVWNLAEKLANNIINGAHAKLTITAVAWLDDSTIVSASHDKCVKQWLV